VTDQVIVPARREPPSEDQSAIEQSAIERARWELAAMAGRLRMLDRQLADSRAENERLTQELAREREHARALRQSDSYRLGKATVSLLKHPVRSTPRLARAVLRRLRPGQRRTAAIPAARRPAGSAAAARLPVHLYVAVGLNAEALRAFVQTLNQRLLVNADHSPVVVTDCPAFALLRKLGVVLEYLPDQRTWQTHRPDLPWDDVLFERLSRLHRDHDSVRTVIVDRRHPPTLAELLR
jgi:hypothetical protein